MAYSNHDAPITVLVVDDHGVVRRGMQSYLELLTDIQCVGEAEDGRKALDRVAALDAAGEPPDVVMMDLVMPGMDGIRATAVLKQRYPDVQAVAMTSFAEVERIQEALEAGAAGYLLKDASVEAVAAAIRAASRGEVYLDSRVAQRLAESLRAPRTAGAHALTAREREVLVQVAHGLSNQQIARRLSISERTARSHVSSILTKLGLASRTQAALWAIREGLVPRPTADAPNTTSDIRRT
jgi:DNA-binding NarL/FixJ family response regulator